MRLKNCTSTKFLELCECVALRSRAHTKHGRLPKRWQKIKMAREQEFAVFFKTFRKGCFKSHPLKWRQPMPREDHMRLRHKKQHASHGPKLRRRRTRHWGPSSQLKCSRSGGLREATSSLSTPACAGRPTDRAQKQIFLTNITAVSYTHLDVYKRQA